MRALLAWYGIDVSVEKLRNPRTQSFFRLNPSYAAEAALKLGSTLVAFLVGDAALSPNFLTYSVYFVDYRI